jgi:ATP-dependent Clp protease ATP-binding subunit ClpC
MQLELTQPAKNLLAERGFDPVLGARPLRRTIQREIEDILSEKILYGELQAGQIVVVDVEADPDATVTKDNPEPKRFVFRGEVKPVAPDVPMVEAAAAGEGAPAPEA